MNGLGGTSTGEFCQRCEDFGEVHGTKCPFHPDFDPTPYCSYGHMTKVQCDCGPIAEND